MVFNIPELIGKNIGQVRAILGSSDYPEGDEPDEETLKRWRLQRSLGLEADQDEWFNEFTRNDQDLLLVTFDSRTREVKDVFLRGDDAAGTNPDSTEAVRRLMQKGNLSASDPGYRVQVVKARNAPGITGLTIVSTGARVLPLPGEADDSDATALDTAQPREWKVWRDSAKEYQRIEATFVTAVKGTVTLKKQDGETIKVRMERLSPGDRAFVQQRTWTTR